jgi:hypothetical protein
MKAKAHRYLPAPVRRANAFLETDLEELRAAISMGYARGQLLPHDRKDWYD